MPKTKKIGRPKLPKGHAKGVIRPVRFTEAELKLFEKAAKASEHKTLSGWIRHMLREAATDNNEGQ
jgi:hypothetical protein